MVYEHKCVSVLGPANELSPISHFIKVALEHGHLTIVGMIGQKRSMESPD